MRLNFLNKLVLVIGGLLICASLSALNAWAGDPYTVKNVHIDVTAPNAQQAQTMARTQGQAKAANILINRLTLKSERTAKGFSGVSSGDGAKMIRSLKIDNEKRSANRYIGDMNVDFNPRAIAQYLRLKGLTLIATQSRERLVIPVLEGQSLWAGNAWNNAWKERDDSNALTPLSVIRPRAGLQAHMSDPTGDHLSLPNLQSIGAIFGVQQILLAKASQLTAMDGRHQYRVTIQDIALDTGNARTLGPVTGTSARQALSNVVSTLEEDWKANAISPQNSESKTLPVTVLYNSHHQWQKMQDIINGSAQIRSARLEAISRRGALMRLSYGGDLDKLRNELAFKGVYLTQDDKLGTVISQSR